MKNKELVQNSKPYKRNVTIVKIVYTNVKIVNTNVKIVNYIFNTYINSLHAVTIIITN